jgi:polyisoprenoid-binding protein YceI
MRKILLFVALGMASYGYAQNDVTFKVDMNEFTGDFTEVQLNGTFNSWCGDCNPMSDDDQDGVWELTIPLEDESIEFKYTYDNWTGQETLSPGSACTITDGAFTNRVLAIEGDTVLPVVCWESCVACTGVPANALVTFKVDLSEYTGSYTSVNLNGTFNNWCGACAVMTDDDMDDVYELTISVPTMDTVEFKYTLDGWAFQEELTEGDPCTLTTIDDGESFTNRFLVLTADTVLPAVCWNACVACNALSIEENNWLKNVVVAPNPSEGIFNISADLASSTNISINVTDVQGKVVYQSNETTSIIRQRIDLSHVENGMYLINVISDNGKISEKVFINK